MLLCMCAQKWKKKNQGYAIETNQIYKGIEIWKPADSVPLCDQANLHLLQRKTSSNWFWNWREEEQAKWNRGKRCAFCMQGRSSRADSGLVETVLWWYSYLFKPLNIPSNVQESCNLPPLLSVPSLLSVHSPFFSPPLSTKRNERARAGTYREHVQIYW